MKVSSVNVGRAQSVQAGGRSVTSAILKRAVAGPVAVKALGLDGDEQADLAVHGSLGESLTLHGLTEDRAWIGDRLCFPHCVLAVGEPRRPCAKFDRAMGFAQAARLMTRSAWCGFYLAVIEPGTIEAGEAFEVLVGPREVRVDELFRATASPRCAA